MPSLKDLDCSIELHEPRQTLQEYGSTYGDGFVETFVAVPSEPQHFAIRLRSTAYIAEGLAMYVYIDGVYQCNRNRAGLKHARPSDTTLGRRSLVDFVVRQKEERLKNGQMIAREWSFEKLNTVSADQAPQQCSPNVLENIGCIEVIVLRCRGSRVKPSGLNLDGPNDMPDEAFGMDGPWDYGFDDRSLPGQRTETQPRNRTSGFAYSPSMYRQPYPPNRRSASQGPPSLASPMMEPRAARSQRSHSQHPSETVLANSRIPPGMVQYGAGPIPHHSPRRHRPESVQDLFNQRTPSDMSPNILDPIFLKQITEEAYRRGLEDMRRKKEMEQQHGGPHPPGTWAPRPEHMELLTVRGAENERRSASSSRSRQPSSTRGSQNIAEWTSSDTGGSYHHQPQASEASGWSHPNGSDSGTWETIESSKRQNSRSLSNAANPTHMNGWSNGPSTPTNQKPPSRHRRSTTSRKSTATKTTAGPPSTLEAAENWSNHDTQSSWSTVAESSQSTITSPRSAISRSQGQRSQSSRKTAPREAERSWGSHPPAPSVMSVASSFSESTSHELPPGVSPDLSPFGLSPDFFQLEESGSRKSSRKSKSGSRSASRLSTNVDDSPLDFPVKIKDTSSSKSKAHDSDKSKSKSKKSSQKKPDTTTDTWDTSWNSNNTGKSAMPGGWSASPSSVASSTRTVTPGKKDDNGWGTSWEVNDNSNEKQAGPTQSPSTKDSNTGNKPDENNTGADASNDWANVDTSWEVTNNNSNDQTNDANTGWDTSGWDTGNQDTKDKKSEKSNSSSKRKEKGSSKKDESKSSPKKEASKSSSKKEASKSSSKKEASKSSSKKESESGDAAKASETTWNVNGDDWSKPNDNSANAWDTGNNDWNQDTTGDDKKDSSSQKDAANDWNVGANGDDNGWDTNQNQDDTKTENTGAWTAANDDDNNADAGATGNDQNNDATDWNTGNDQNNDATDWNTGGDAWETGDNNNADDKKSNADKKSSSSQKAQEDSGANEWGDTGETSWEAANNNADENKSNADKKSTTSSQKAPDNTAADANAWENTAWDTAANNADDDKRSKKSNDDKKSTSSSSKARKSRLQSYHRGNRSHKLTPQPHWTFPKSPASSLHPIIEDPPAEPLFTIPDTKAKEEGLEHQVRPGKPEKYSHAVNRPEYIDSMSAPYAVFRFKYRTRGYLRDLLGKDEVPKTEGGDTKKVETASVIRERIRGLSEDELVREIMKLKGLAAVEEKKEEEKKSEKAGTDIVKAAIVENWVGEQQELSRQNSIKAVSKKSSTKGSEKKSEKAESKKSGSKKSEKPAEEWNATTWDDGGGNANNEEKKSSVAGSKKSGSKKSEKPAEDSGGGEWDVPAWDYGTGDANNEEKKDDGAAGGGGDQQGVMW